MLGHFKKVLPHDFRQRLKRSLFSQQDMSTRLLNLRRAGFQSAAAIDGGAFKGDWALEYWKAWPTAPIAFVEPLPDKTQLLSRLAAQVPGSKVVAKALGKTPGEVRFRLSETNSGIATGTKESDEITVGCTTLDEMLAAKIVCHANLLKLDLQGHELEALSGCQ